MKLFAFYNPTLHPPIPKTNSKIKILNHWVKTLSPEINKERLKVDL